MATDHKERYLVDEAGNRVAVLIGIDEYQSILDSLEELELINAYDKAKGANDEVIPFDQAIREVENARQ